MESIPALRVIGAARFFSDSTWHPTEGFYNLAPMLYGTFLVVAGSLLLATPLGILSAIFCNFVAGEKTAHFHRRLVELLAGIPSVVYGFFGLMVLVPVIGSIEPPGPSLLAGILVLTIMILPIIALTADESLASVPKEYIRSAAALGLSRRAIVTGVVLPAAKSGLMTGVILETGRAIGETMALMMVCGNVVQMPDSIFAPMRTLTVNIALEMAYAMGDHRSALFVSGLMLMIMTTVLIAVAEYLSRKDIHGSLATV